MLDDGWFEIMFLQERVSLLRKLERKEGGEITEGFKAHT